MAEWRDIADYDGVYQVSDRGQVRNTQSSKILQPVKIKNGRLYVTLSSSGFQRKCTVHSLVAAAFLGDCPPNHEITRVVQLKRTGFSPSRLTSRTLSTRLTAKASCIATSNLEMFS